MQVGLTMNEACWDMLRDEESQGGRADKYKRHRHFPQVVRAHLAISTALLIIAGLIVIAVAGVTMHKTYYQNEQMKAALKMARDQNRQIEINTSNGFEFVLNIGKGSNISIAGSANSVSSVVVYPRNYKTERIVRPDGVVITPYSMPKIELLS